MSVMGRHLMKRHIMDKYMTDGQVHGGALTGSTFTHVCLVIQISGSCAIGATKVFLFGLPRVEETCPDLCGDPSNVCRVADNAVVCASHRPNQLVDAFGNFPPALMWVNS